MIGLLIHVLLVMATMPRVVSGLIHLGWIPRANLLSLDRGSTEVESRSPSFMLPPWLRPHKLMSELTAALAALQRVEHDHPWLLPCPASPKPLLAEHQPPHWSSWRRSWPS